VKLARMFVVPAPGLKVPVPEARPPLARHLPPEGAEVEATEYWRRRIADGDVRLAAAAQTSKEKSK
jgi:hypothetical protein